MDQLISVFIKMSTLQSHTISLQSSVLLYSRRGYTVQLTLSEILQAMLLKTSRIVFHLGNILCNKLRRVTWFATSIACIIAPNVAPCVSCLVPNLGVKLSLLNMIQTYKNTLKYLLYIVILFFWGCFDALFHTLRLLLSACLCLY